MNKKILILPLLVANILFSYGLETGGASWYGGKFQGRMTANGEIFDTNKFTAAHKTLPFNTIVEVTDIDTGKKVYVRINDRGPFVEGRIIDLSRAAAEQIGLVGKGVTRVKLRIVSEPEISEKGKIMETFSGLTPPRKAPASPATIQIASFSVKKNAERIIVKLTEAGLNPEIERSPSGHYRVVLTNIGPDKLENIKKELNKLGFSSVLIRY